MIDNDLDETKETISTLDSYEENRTEVLDICDRWNFSEHWVVFFHALGLLESWVCVSVTYEWKIGEGSLIVFW